MAAIKGKNTRPEMLVRRALHGAGFRYRLHGRDLAGRPDIVLTSLRTVVLVHGCFWHNHGCRGSAWPKTRAKFWREKLEGNAARDRRTTHFLKAAGWNVEVIWECELKGNRRIGRLLRTLTERRHAL